MGSMAEVRKYPEVSNIAGLGVLPTFYGVIFHRVKKRGASSQ
ncbi:hypothetical protein OP10G_1616 [Fimbriimonas ginsengisoli Gsoil 348]|uniref:Uncharacterized protein n=1 Tax=Fimbriimonas ginsengisoli Gsoil 348 TaxID=661478 RepID=A0A068NTQ5_FIMGI|nr:hypothetical protein OP10G_1616 [Fimbriimonas ginsengisoli Gsoil 348]